MSYLELAKKVLEKKGQGVEPIPGQPIPPETLEAIFQEVLEDLNRRTLEGLLGEANPAMLAQVNGAQARVDKFWQACLQGKASLENFREAVRQWHEAVVSLFTSPQAQRPLSQERLL